MKTYSAPICSCTVCKKQFSSKGIHSHHRLSHDPQAKIEHRERMIKHSVQISNKLKQRSVDKFQQAPSKCCKWCDTVLTYTQRHNTFCSKSCSASFNNTGRVVKRSTKEKLSKYCKSNPTGIITNRTVKSRKGIYKTCLSEKCSNVFYTYPSKSERKYCSFNCAKLYSGGERKNSGNSKGGYYQGVYLASTYELCYYIFCVDHDISITRNKDFWYYTYRNQRKRYFPDFRVNGRLVEIKGYHTPIVDPKLQAVDEPIDILYEKDLLFAFKYVSERYSVNDFSKLYD